MPRIACIGNKVDLGVDEPKFSEIVARIEPAFAADDGGCALTLVVVLEGNDGGTDQRQLVSRARRVSRSPVRHQVRITTAFVFHEAMLD